MSEETAFIMAWVLSGAAGLLLCWALFFDLLCKVRKRVPHRRCPKCWYDLSHTPGTTCSECGYTAKRERQLRKARVRKRWAALAVVLGVGSWSLPVHVRARTDGWLSVMPTTVLILLLPEAESHEEGHYDEQLGNWIVNPFAQEMQRRVFADEVADWQIKWAIERCRVVRTRKRWPVDEPLRVGLFKPIWMTDWFTVKARLQGGKEAEYIVNRMSGTWEAWREAERQN